jgi:hypothetical protein
MPIPWLAALRLIPWGTIISHAPAIKRSADAILTGARETSRMQGAELHALAARLDMLDARSQAEADLARQIADQLEGLTVACEVLAARVRWLVIGIATAIALSITALVVAIVW